MPAPAIAQRHPKPPAYPCLRRPASSCPRPLLYTQCQHQIAPAYRPSDGGNSRSEVGSGTLAFVWTQQKMPQKLSPEGELTGGAAHPTGDGHASAVRCAKSPIQGPDSKGRV
jgi:hypothetical protein